MEFSEYVLVDKKPVVTHDIRKWGEFMKSKDRIVAQDHVRHYLVSTVFLGIDHSFGSGEPLLFETMVFDENTKHEMFGQEFSESLDNYQERYHTWEEAEVGHKRIVDMVEMGGTK